MPSRNIKTAKDILSSHDFLTERIQSSRFVHHEFQDYAYRLAADLGDLAHKQIYMRLAKTTPRHILEKALAFTGDYKDINRGKLFMWKLKQIREELKQNQDNLNFDAQFIFTRTGANQDQFASELYRKQVKQLEVADILTSLAEHFKETKRLKALVAGQNAIVAPILLSNNFSVDSWELSRKLVTVLKPKVKKVKRIIPSTEKFKANQFNLIWFSEYWKLVPLEFELELLKHILESLRSNGILIISTNESDKLQQSWEQFVHKEKPVFYFHKNENSERISALLPKGVRLQKLGSGYLMIQK